MDMDIAPKKLPEFNQKTIQNIDLESIALFVDMFVQNYVFYINVYYI